MTEPEPTDWGAEWERLTWSRAGGGDVAYPSLAVPSAVIAHAGRGQVTLDWSPVDGAAGYVVRRADSPDGPFVPLDIGEPWVRPVPHAPLTDTTGTPGTDAWYTVAAVAAVDDHGQPQSAPVPATPLPHGEASCRIAVDAARTVGELARPWRPMIGSERLSQLGDGVGPGGRHIGDEFAEALRRAHTELGVRTVRAHAILHDDVGVYREVGGEPVHDFTTVDRIYDRVLALGLRPIVEVSFMPRDLARDPDQTVFHYGAIVSPPKDWDRWAALVGDLTAHLVERYGLDEVRTWAFEVWNEANLDVFWGGTQEEYFRLYDISAAAIKAVDPDLPVGGPGSAAAAWVDALLEHADTSGAPVDFVSTHCYGNAPLDLRPVVARHGRPGLPVYWTEWGAHATHFNRAHDSVWSAAYLVRGMVSAMGRIEALSYWTLSDHFEELGRAPALLHGGFGLLALGNLPKPRWWGLWMLEQLGSTRLEVSVARGGAGDMVDAVASRGDDGRLTLVVWNGTVDVSKADGSKLLDRDVTLDITGVGEGRYRLRHRRLDHAHSDLNSAWGRIAGGRDWPEGDEWEQLAAASELADYEPEQYVRVTGRVTLQFTMPMPSVSLIELDPAG